jgi:uncharacterized membrane protein
MIVMALDHAREYFHAPAILFDPEDLTRTTAALFFTRWITHFCAPVFVFLAGTSAGLMTARRTPAALGRFLLARGLWLVLLEATLITFAWTFTLGATPEMQGRHLVILQVIWALGASMVVLAGAQFLGRRACLVLGAGILVLHNALDPFWPAGGMGSDGLAPWVGLHAQMAVSAGPLRVLVAYPLLAWIGVMLLGFGSSAMFELAPAQRNRRLLLCGLALTLLFLVLRALDLYGEPRAWHAQPAGTTATILSFLNVTKYPPSLLFLLMTLGPAALFCSFADAIRGPVRNFLSTLGRVPFAFYVAHIFLIHGLAIALGAAQGFAPGDFVTIFLFFPKGFGVPLPAVYLAWVLVVALLWLPCRAMADLKARRKDWWLSYL